MVAVFTCETTKNEARLLGRGKKWNAPDNGNNNNWSLTQVLILSLLILSEQWRTFFLNYSYIRYPGYRWNTGEIHSGWLLQRHGISTASFLSSNKKTVCLRNRLIDLFSLYVLFSHFRPCDATRGNSFFQMSSYARANVRIINERTKGKFAWGQHVVWNGKTKCTS